MEVPKLGAREPRPSCLPGERLGLLVGEQPVFDGLGKQREIGLDFIGVTLACPGGLRKCCE